ncbi:MAG: hypothetical protein WD851_23795 [Pirellulales bacterium]
MNYRNCPRVVLCIALALLAGCNSQPTQGTLEGKVTLDGAPLKSGLIRFVPTDGQTPTADATITDGTFRATVPPGEKRVEINAPQVTGQRKAYDTPDSPTVDVVHELLPTKYNVNSELVFTVQAGSQTPEFALQSK